MDFFSKHPNAGRVPNNPKMTQSFSDSQLFTEWKSDLMTLFHYDSNIKNLNFEKVEHM